MPRRSSMPSKIDGWLPSDHAACRLSSALPLTNCDTSTLKALVTNHISEAFDLDFKRDLYGNADADKRALATDVAALANTAGGLLVLGIEEDRQARAVTAPGVAVSDGEITRILSIVGSRVVPLPVFDVLPVLRPGETGHGFIVIAVARDALAPHAVIVNKDLRYPRREGTITGYLSEPEVASAYRERLAGAQRQGTRIDEIEREALERLSTGDTDVPWVVVSLVPDLPGEMTINSEVFRTFRNEIAAPVPLIGPGFGTRFYRASVGRRRLLADGSRDDSLLAKWASLELHADGSGVCAIGVLDLLEGRRVVPPLESEPVVRRVGDESLVNAVMSGVLLLARHARDRAAAGGNALVRAQIYPMSHERPMGLGHTRHYGFPDSLGDRVLTAQPPPAETAAELDDLAQGSRVLAAATGMLVNEIGQAFGVPEMALLSHDGRMRRRAWGQDHQIITWAEGHGIEVTDEIIA
jgi:hypothetical protein